MGQFIFKGNPLLNIRILATANPLMAGWAAGKKSGIKTWADFKGKRIATSKTMGGGSGYVPQHERVWNVVSNHKPLAFFALGDNTYHDTPTRPDHQRYCYYRRQSRPEYRDFIAHTAVYAIYDDHDFGTNDCIPGPEVDTPE